MILNYVEKKLEYDHSLVTTDVTDLLPETPVECSFQLKSSREANLLRHVIMTLPTKRMNFNVSDIQTIGVDKYTFQYKLRQIPIDEDTPMSTKFQFNVSNNTWANMTLTSERLGSDHIFGTLCPGNSIKINEIFVEERTDFSLVQNVIMVPEGKKWKISFETRNNITPSQVLDRAYEVIRNKYEAFYKKIQDNDPLIVKGNTYIFEDDTLGYARVFRDFIPIKHQLVDGKDVHITTEKNILDVITQVLDHFQNHH